MEQCALCEEFMLTDEEHNWVSVQGVKYVVCEKCKNKALIRAVAITRSHRDGE